MIIRSADDGVLIDLAVNAPPDLPAAPTPAGPTLAPEELVGHKLLALFDRAAARDFADIYVLARRFGKNVLLACAKQIDAGFDTKVLAGMIATLDRFTDSEHGSIEEFIRLGREFNTRLHPRLLELSIARNLRQRPDGRVQCGPASAPGNSDAVVPRIQAEF